jgi:nucleoside-triphosphatase
MSETPRARKTLLLTGLPGVGKTTVLRRVAEALEGWRLSGFLTEEIRVRGRRLGFSLKTFSGREWILAHVEFRGGARVGRYGIDLGALEDAVRHTLTRASGVDLFLVDEIGKMECKSPRFVEAMRRLVAADVPLVATVARRGPGFIEEVKSLPGIALREVTLENRDSLPGEVLSWIREARR